MSLSASAHDVNCGIIIVLLVQAIVLMWQGRHSLLAFCKKAYLIIAILLSSGALCSSYSTEPQQRQEHNHK